jgi:hypothetical protein
MVRGLSEGYHRDRNVLLFANDELEKLAIATQPTMRVMEHVSIY